MPALFPDREALATLCRRHRIRRLSLFGSVRTGTARPDSDVDLLVEFEPGGSRPDRPRGDRGRVVGAAGRRAGRSADRPGSEPALPQRGGAVGPGAVCRLRIGSGSCTWGSRRDGGAVHRRSRPRRSRRRPDAAVRAGARDRDPRRGGSKVTRGTRAALPLVPWGQIVAMRNRLIHAYFDINRDVLWKTASEEVPDLLPRSRRHWVKDRARNEALRRYRRGAGKFGAYRPSACLRRGLFSPTGPLPA